MPPQSNYELAQVIALRATFGGQIGSLLGNLDFSTRESSEAAKAWLIENYEGQLDGEALATYLAFLSAIDALIATFAGGN